MERVREPLVGQRNGQNDEIPMYLRLSPDERNVKNINKLMTDIWCLNKPDVILSIVGGGERFRLPVSHRKAIFNQGLINAVKMTNGWILSQGVNNGVAKAIGDAVREGQYDKNDKSTGTIHSIGITPWHIVNQREKFINLYTNKYSEVHHQIAEFDRDLGTYSLNPDHSHFLLVDNESVNGNNSIEKFRASLEKQLSIDYRVICLLIDGGINSFDHICDSLQSDTLVLICKGSGRFADILADALNLFTRLRPSSLQDENYRNKLKSAIKKNLNFIASSSNQGNKEKTFNRLFDEVVNIIFYHNKKLTVFDVDKDALDKTIIELLLDLKPKTGQRKPIDRLELALRLNASAIAASKIFADRKFNLNGVGFQPKFFQRSGPGCEIHDSYIAHWSRDEIQRQYSENRIKSEEVAKHLKTTLIQDKVDFVKLFADYGALDATKFNAIQLCQLYSEAFRQKEASYMKFLLEEMKIGTVDGTITLHHVKKIIKKFSPFFRNDIYYATNGLKLIKDPFQELFIWAVLFNRKQLALFFWENCNKPLSMAVFGCLLCNGMKRSMKSIYEPLVGEFRALKKELLQRAVGIVDHAYLKDRKKAMQMVQCPIEMLEPLQCMLRSLNSMDVAGLANARAYFSSSCCQQVIKEQWKRGFEASGWSIVWTAVVIPIGPLFFVGPLWPTLFLKNIRFKDSLSKQSSSDQNVSNNGSRCSRYFANYVVTPFDKLVTFYSSPVVKFTLHMACFLFYLLLYAIVMLFYYPTAENHGEIHWTEILLYIMKTPGKNPWARFKGWWNHSAFRILNRLEVCFIILSVVAFSIRCWAATIPLPRLLMLIAMFFCFMHIYKAHYASIYLGPKVIMLKRMSRDLLMFLLVFVVFMVAYSISVRSLIHPNKDLYFGIFWDLFQQGIWETFGEPADETKTGKDLVAGCNETDLTLPPASGNWDCFFRVYPIPIFLAVYLFFGSILLINMLIAIFSHVFQQTQTDSEEIWRYQMYSLFKEFDEKLFLPPPFLIFQPLWLIITNLYQKCRQSNDGDESKEVKCLESFERICRQSFIDSQNSALSAEKSQIDSIILQLQNTASKLIDASDSQHSALSVGKSQINSIILQLQDTASKLVDASKVICQV